MRPVVKWDWGVDVQIRVGPPELSPLQRYLKKEEKKKNSLFVKELGPQGPKGPKVPNDQILLLRINKGAYLRRT